LVWINYYKMLINGKDIKLISRHFYKNNYLIQKQINNKNNSSIHQIKTE
jgi:hypothetical protein